MGITEIVIYILVGLIGIAFTTRILIEFWKIIYAMAPIIVAIIFCMTVVIVLGEQDIETEVKDANHIESIEDQSRRGEH